MRRFSTRRWLCLCAMLLAGLQVAAARADEQGLFEQANAAFAAGEFKQAIALYRRLVDAGETSAALFYNIGNAWYRAGDPGRAILNYERALALDPSHPETTANLQLVRDKTRALEMRPRPAEGVFQRFSVRDYTIAGTVTFWVGAFAAAAWISSKRRSALTLVGALMAFAATGVCAYGICALQTGVHGNGFSVVVANGVTARLATADNAGSVLALPPGSSVKILSTRGDWSFAALPNDLRGWIPAESAEPVRL